MTDDDPGHLLLAERLEALAARIRVRKPSRYEFSSSRGQTDEQGDHRDHVAITIEWS